MEGVFEMAAPDNWREEAVAVTQTTVMSPAIIFTVEKVKVSPARRVTFMTQSSTWSLILALKAIRMAAPREARPATLEAAPRTATQMPTIRIPAAVAVAMAVLGVKE